MRPRLTALSIVAITAAALLVAWVYELSLENLLVLAPVIVVGAAAAAGLLVLWTRVGLEWLQASRHPRRVVVLLVAGLVLVAVLTVLGVELPREG